SSAAQSDIGPRTSRTQNDFNTLLGYRFTRRFEADLTYNRSDARYNQAFTALNRGDNIYGIKFAYSLTEQIFATLDYKYKDLNFIDADPGVGDNSSKVNAIQAGLRFEPTARTSGSIQAGFESKDFDAQSRRDVDAFIAGLTLSYKMTPRFTISPTASYTLEDSTAPTYPVIRSTKFSLNFTEDFSDRLRLTFGGGGTLDRFERAVLTTVARSEDTYDANAALTFRVFEWLSAAFKYELRHKESTLPGGLNDFTDNKFTLSGTAQF
ncbi:MAG: outer membrane beta-barrel protein, partial [Candidatus Tectomicrobia bacterium]|nr:outer membrane beta-barrel protein [Candidatus Tectomicrobia bacterium]